MSPIMLQLALQDKKSECPNKIHKTALKCSAFNLSAFCQFCHKLFCSCKDKNLH